MLPVGRFVLLAERKTRGSAAKFSAGLSKQLLLILSSFSIALSRSMTADLF
jgi:hypothetical protein